MSDDYAANAQTTGTVAVGGSATGTIETAYDHDWFAVELVAGRTYQFDLQGSPGGGGTLPDTYFRAIYDSEGRYQSGTYNDNFEGSRDSRVTFTPTDSGTYYARASGDRDEIGSYTLSVRDVTPPEAGNPPPAFDQQSYAFDLAEETDGSANRLSLGTVSATDPDGGSVSYGIAGGNAAARFEIDAASGELFYVGAGEDYDTGTTSFNLTVRASDGEQTTDTSVTVNVTDVDEPVEDNPPVTEPDQSTAQTVSEPSGEDFARNSSTSGRIAVGDTATGRIGSSGDRDWFAVELVAGRTYVIDLRGSPTDDGTLSDPYLRGIYDADGDRISGTLNNDAGTGRNSRVTFTATESGTHYIAAGAYSSRQGTYELEVTDTSSLETPQEQIQQQPPAFGSQFYAFELEENADGSANRLSLGTVSATDPDGGSVSYSIAGGNSAGLFELDAASGELFYTGGGEDYEAGSTSFNLTVRASDGDETTDATVTVNVTDVAEAPAFAQAGYAFDLAEDTDGSTNRISLGTVTATDPDGGSVTYSIEGGNESARFEIDAASGELFYVGAGEDYETGSTRFELTVRASDGEQTTDTSVTVNVTDEDEPVVVDPPVAQEAQSVPQTVSEPAGEDFARNSSTSGRVAVGDTATGRVGSSGDRDWFAVDLVAGRTYVIDLRGSPTGDGTLSDPYLRGIYDADGDRISNTTDDDGGQGYNSRVTFTATESGTHYIAAGAYSGQGTYEVEVTDTSPPTEEQDADSEDPPDRQEQVQEQPPAFGSQFYGFELEENADGSTDRISLGAVSATDPDGGSVTYSIEGGNAAGLFEIDAASGELFYSGGGEDYETGAASYELTVRASDGDQTSDATVTVNVTDVAEAPAFGQAGYAFDLAEDTDGSANRISLGTVTATDPDGGSVTYSIEGGNAAGLFEIDAASGELFYVGAGEDYETGSTRFELTVRASDGDQTTDATVTVNVTDVDEPVVDDPPVAQEVQSVPQTVSEGDTDLPNDNSTRGRVAVGGWATGTIGTARDNDRFAVELVAGRTYQFDLEGSPGGGGTLPDTYFRAIYDSAGRYQSGSYNDNFEGSRDSRVTFTPTASGTYYARVSGDRNETGTYTLTVTDVTAPETDGASTDPVTPEAQEPTSEIVGPDEAEPPVPDTAQAQGEQASVSEDDTDLPTDTTTPGRVAVGGSATGAIGVAGDQDWFAVELEAGKTYRIDLKESPTGDDTLVDPYLRGIYDEDGERIGGTTDNDGGEGRDSRVIFTPGEDATYYVAASADGNEVGTYTLSVTEVADDYAADPATTGTVAVGGSVAGYIEPPGDEDWFAVELVADKTYRIDLERVRADHPVLDQPHIPEWLYIFVDYMTNGSTWDPYLRGIYDADGSLIDGTTNDDGGQGRNSRVHFTPQETNTYYVAAGAYDTHIGAYTLSVTDVTDDHGAAPDTAGMVAVDGSVEGRIEPPGDQDWFAVELEAGTRYRFDLKGSWTGDGTLADPYLLGIHDADGNEIPGTQDNDGGERSNSRVTFTPVAAGTYYVAAGADGGCVGTYTLSVEEVDGM